MTLLMIESPDETTESNTSNHARRRALTEEETSKPLQDQRDSVKKEECWP